MLFLLRRPNNLVVLTLAHVLALVLVLVLVLAKYCKKQASVRSVSHIVTT
jgi:hypothetical protein